MRLVDDSGNPVPVGQVGEIQIKGRNVLKGYGGRPGATAAAMQDGWFSTGALATVDDECCHVNVDRKKDLVIRGGCNVYPREVEEVLHEHPAVADVAVMGVPHAILGEEVRAAVALRPGTSVTAQGLVAFVKERLAANKYPRSIRVMNELPKSAAGEFLRREVSLTDAPAIAADGGS